MTETKERLVVVYCRKGCNGHLVEYPPAVQLAPLCKVGVKT